MTQVFENSKNTLRIAASVFALIPTVKVVAVASTSSEDELLANAFSAIVIPFVLKVPAGSSLVRQEAKFCVEKVQKFLMVFCHQYHKS